MKKIGLREIGLATVGIGVCQISLPVGCKVEIVCSNPIMKTAIEEVS